MKKTIVIFLIVAFAFALSACEDKNASKRAAEFVSGGAESIQSKAPSSLLMHKASAGPERNRMLPLCGGMPSVSSKTDFGGTKENNYSTPQVKRNGAVKLETQKVKGSI